MTIIKRILIVTFSLVLSVAFSFPSLAITLKEEAEIGDEFITTIRSHYPLIQDTEITDYLSELGEKILKEFPEQAFKYHFYIIKDDVFNAFAGPGGHIFINSGLFAALNNEEELAGIIGHEISHVACRHISDRIERAGKIGLSTIAGVAAGIFLGVYGDPAAGTALTAGSIAGGQALSLNYSRKDEMQADRFGLERLNSAGFSGRGLISGLGIIRSKQWFGSEQIPVYLTTHPALEDRMSYISGWIETNEKETPLRAENSYKFNMAHTKVVAQYSTLSSAKKSFKKTLETSPDDVFANYGYGITLARSRKYKTAISHLKKAIEKNAFHTGMLKTLGRVYFDSGDHTKAQTVFEGVLTIIPGDFKSNLYYSRCLAESGELDKAIETIEEFATEDSGERLAFYYLADIYARKNLLVESYYYLGLYYKARRDFKNALLQFNRALAAAKDPLMKKKVEDQLQALDGGKKKKSKAEKTIKTEDEPNTG